jgi:hypothetical protein
MEHRHQVVKAAAVRLDTFLASAVQEFAVSLQDKAQMCRIERWIKQAQALPRCIDQKTAARD